MRTLLLAPLLCLVIASAAPIAQAPASADDQRVFEKFRAWVTRQPPPPAQAGGQAAEPVDLMAKYRSVLASEGIAAAEIERQIRMISEQGQRLEIERWNRVLTAEQPAFNTRPNDFLVRIASRRSPGTALNLEADVPHRCGRRAGAPFCRRAGRGTAPQAASARAGRPG